MPADEQLHWGFDRPDPSLDPVPVSSPWVGATSERRAFSAVRRVGPDDFTPFAAVFRQRTEQGAHANLHAVPETLPVKSLGQLMPEVGWIQIPMNDPTSVLELSNGRSRSRSFVIPICTKKFSMLCREPEELNHRDGWTSEKAVRTGLLTGAIPCLPMLLPPCTRGQNTEMPADGRRLRPENWERFDVPRGSKSSQPMGEISYSGSSAYWTNFPWNP